MSTDTKNLSVLGATGSIGINALNVVRSYPDLYRIRYLSAHSQADKLIEQALEFLPDAVSIGAPDQFQKVRNALPGIEVLQGRAGLLEIAGRDDVDTMLNGLVGSAGMEPTIKSIQAGVNIALSNKESLVMAGDYINGLLKEHAVNLYPVDSEHSAIWQCLTGESQEDIKRLLITGSGGPFRTLPIESFNNITVAQALKHPNWVMGRKITIDSATMMNKGLEVIEARWLFHLPASKIDIVVHPQSIIHSMVEFLDGSVKAQLGIPDMKIPIQYALSYPRHLKQDWEHLDLAKVGTLTFEEPDLDKFRCIQLAFDALEQGGSVPVVLNVANEEAVYRFLDGEISFNAIPELITKAIDAHEFLEHPNLDDILALEQWTQAFIKRS